MVESGGIIMTDYVWHDENYDQRIQLTIDGTKIDGDMTDFPVLIHLSDASGITNVDVTDVFDELTSSGVLYDNTWNENDKAAGISLSNGDLTATMVSSAWDAVRSILARSSGKWYWEVKLDVVGDTNNMIGIGTFLETLTYPGDTTEGYGYYGANGNAYNNTASSYGNSYTTNDIISVALDLDNGKIWWAKNGTWQGSPAGVPASGTNPAYTDVIGKFYAMVGFNASGNKATANFGASAFTYTPPTGFQAGFSSDITNDKKIAVYTTSGTQDVQCYTEIEKWVTTSGSEQAWLWVKVPTLSSGTDAVIYLYYDKDVSDNTSYIGDTGDYAAKQVWDNNFVGVWHMAQDPFGSDVLDSTSYTNDGSPNGSMTPIDLVGAKIGDGIDFDGSNDYLDCGKDAELDITEAITLEAVFKYTTGGNYRRMIAKQYGAAGTNNACYQLGIMNNNKLRFSIPPTFDLYNYGNTLNDGNYHYGVGIYDSGASDMVMLLDNSIIHTSSSYSTAIRSNSDKLLEIADEEGSSSYNYNDVIDEVRISNIARSETWIHLTYYTSWDELITFGAKEDKPSFIFNGYVQVLGSPVAREVYLYHRSTGELVGSAISSPSTGYFEIPTPFNDYHFVNILPGLSEDYNILVEDKIKYGS